MNKDDEIAITNGSITTRYIDINEADASNWSDCELPLIDE